MRHIKQKSSFTAPCFGPSLTCQSFRTGLLALLLSVFVSAGEPHRALAATPQTIYFANLLSQAPSGAVLSKISQVPVAVYLYNGSSAPCFHITLAYGMSVNLQTGGKSPCVAPIQTITATPLAGLLGVLYAPPTAYAVDSAYSIVSVQIVPLQGPTFNTTNDFVVSTGTSQFAVQGK